MAKRQEPPPRATSVVEKLLQDAKDKYRRFKHDSDLCDMYKLTAELKRAKSRDADSLTSEQAERALEFDRLLKHARNLHGDCETVKSLCELRKSLTLT